MATGFSNERRLKVNGSIERVGEHATSVQPLHRGAKTCANFENVQRLLGGGARQGSAQALPDIAVQGAVVDTLLRTEIAREAIGARYRHDACTHLAVARYNSLR